MKKLLQKIYLLFLMSGMAHSICLGQVYTGTESAKSEFKWPDGKKAAISLSFDDGRASQVDIGIPLLDAYNLKATFYVNPSNIMKRIEKWKAAASNGHEIGNHTLSHPCSGNFLFARTKALEEYSLKRMSKEISLASDSLEMIFGKKPNTFAYPCGQTFVGSGKKTKSYVPLVAKNFIAGRGWLDEAPNDPTYCDLSQVYGMPSDNSDFNSIKKLIDQAISSGGWLVLVGHDIKPEGERLTTYTSMLEQLCEYVLNPENDLWVATVSEVASYIKVQRENEQNLK